MVFLIDLVIGNVLNLLYFNTKSGWLYPTIYSFEKTKAEMIIIGSSRANHHYIPNVFEKHLDISVYNVGGDGQNLFYQYALLKTVLKRYSPKIIILDFIGQGFEFGQKDYDRLSTILPYYKKKSEIHSIIELKGPFEKIKLLSSIYPFNSLLLTLVFANANKNSSIVNNNDLKGYLPLKEHWKESIKDISYSEKAELDRNKVNIFELFIQDCIKSKINLFIVCSPYYSNFKSLSPSITLAKKIASNYNIAFYDFSQVPVFKNNSSLFKDPSHLNDDGAKIFSDSIADRLVKKYMICKK